MKNLILAAGILCAAFQMAAAQKEAKPGNAEMREIKQEMRRAVAEAKAQAGVPATSAVTAADVGEPDSFGRNAQFLGATGVGVIYVEASCDPADLPFPLGPNERCLEIDPAPNAITTGTFTDLVRITIPARSVSNVVYMINNHTINWLFENSTVNSVPGRMTYSPTITIVSEALNDPAAIDPNTNAPMNGSFTTGGNGTKSINASLFPNFQGLYSDSYSRANTGGLSRTFFAALGLPNNVIDNIYKKPMTIRLGATVSVRNVPFGTFVYSARFFGN